MFRRGCLLLCLLVTSLLTTATVHAQEGLAMAASASGLECSGTVHSDGDSDEMPADSDRAVPHHHSGCHGFAACVQGTAGHSDNRPRTSMVALAPESLAPPRWSIGPHLRPPIA